MFISFTTACDSTSADCAPKCSWPRSEPSVFLYRANRCYGTAASLAPEALGAVLSRRHVPGFVPITKQKKGEGVVTSCDSYVLQSLCKQILLDSYFGTNLKIYIKRFGIGGDSNAFSVIRRVLIVGSFTSLLWKKAESRRKSERTTTSFLLISKNKLMILLSPLFGVGVTPLQCWRRHSMFGKA